MKIIIAIFLLFLIGCTTNSYKNINPKEFKEMIKDDIFIIDVHIPEQDHIEGTDEFIPYNEIMNNIGKLPDDKTTKIIVYCRSGSMSIDASNALINLGYENVFNLEGGRDAYLKEYNGGN